MSVNRAQHNGREPRVSSLPRPGIAAAGPGRLPPRSRRRRRRRRRGLAHSFTDCMLIP